MDDNKKPTFLVAFGGVLVFWCEVTFPNLCTTPGRCYAVVVAGFAAAATVLTQLVPMLLPEYSSNSQKQSSSSFILYVCWSVFALLVCAFLGMAAFVAHVCRKNVKGPTPSALAALEKTRQAKRLIQEEHYDVYVPSTGGSEGQLKNSQYPVGLFFLQGALVDARAYAPVLTKLSNAGILVVIRKKEPLHLATSSGDLGALIDQVEDRHGVTARKWSIGGHSMGAFVAKDLLLQKSNNNKYDSLFESLVMYGITRSGGVEQTRKGLRVLAVTASNDGFFKSKTADPASFDSWGVGGETNKGRFCHVVIQGGNHSGFGDYGPQTFPLADGERTITLHEQHQQIVDDTVKFLLPPSKHE